LNAMATRQMTIAGLVEELPRYAMVKTKMALSADKLGAAFAALCSHFKDAKADELDGLRLDFPESWLLVRGSNTEPIVRAVAEAPTAAEAQALCDTAMKVLAGL